MKTLHFVSILVVAAAATFACRDEDDRVPGSADTSGAAGKSSSAGRPTGGTAGSSAGSIANGGDDGGAGAGANQGGHADLGGAGPDDVAGSAGANALAGAGGAPNESGGADTGGAAGAGGNGDVVSEPLEIIGNWDNNYNGTEIITATDWSGSAIVAYDNALNVVYTQFPADDAYNPNKFGKTVYTQPANDSFYYCMLVYSADTLEAARADTQVADASSPETSGCSGFPWTKATRQ